ncbi:hypothetical protein [Actinomadura gamaensis]|uniref:Uncharacterized protein n=1 Tax=Actinomadura gamaensis TaxID=1763541 RepID=A0ABV9U1I8_9ACTN
MDHYKRAATGRDRGDRRCLRPSLRSGGGAELRAGALVEPFFRAELTPHSLARDDDGCILGVDVSGLILAALQPVNPQARVHLAEHAAELGIVEATRLAMELLSGER